MTEINYTNDGRKDLFVRNKSGESETISLRIDPPVAEPRTVTVTLGSGERRTFERVPELTEGVLTVSAPNRTDQQLDTARHGGTVAVFVDSEIRIQLMTV